ncbi:MAG TPA: protein kinase, partial [Verrucomicrobiae bacterium]|nr:protein kinase [Verrucomicrobiae bacterium]
SRLPATECFAIGAALTRALEHLHGYGLVHRDIKPSNVIFVHGVPKLADIGLVSAVDTSASFVGTEGFVPPEGPGTVQADLYSLGKVLYEISTGRDRKDFPKLPDDIENLPDARALLELNEVTLKACDSELNRRYASAQAMHEDLLLLQAGKSVKRLHQIERRFRMAAKYGIAATALTVAAAAAFLWASNQAQQAERHRLAAEQALRVSQLNEARAKRMTDLAGRRFNTLELLKRSAAASGNRLDLRNEAIACLALPDLRPLKRWSKTPQWDSWRFDSRLRRYFTNDARGNITIRDVDTDGTLASLPGHGGPLTDMIWSPDDRFIATNDKNGKARIWNLAAREATQIDLPPNARLLRFTPDSKSLVARHEDQSLHFLDPSSGVETRSLRGTFSNVQFSPSGSTFCAFTGPQAVVYDATNGTTLATFEHPENVMAAALHPDGRRIATACLYTIHFWDVMTGKQLGVSEGHEGRVIGLLFDRTGELLISSCWDTTTRFWQVDTYRELVRAQNAGNGTTFDPELTRIAFKYWDHSRVEMWQAANGREVRHFQVPSVLRQSYHGGFSPDGNWLYILNTDGVHVFDITLRRPVAMLPCRESATATFHPTGGFFVTCGAEGLRRQPVETEGGFRFGRPEALGPPGMTGVTSFTLTRDGERLATFADDGFRLLNLAQPTAVVRSAPGSRPRSMPTISPDGRWVALGKRGNRLQICDAQTGKVATNIVMSGECVPFFSPDHRWLVAAAHEEYQLRHVGSWQLALTISREGSQFGRRCAAF